MDLSKSYEFFQPEKDDARIHIIGCGSVGSTIAENLARCGVTKMTLWDFDRVEPHNICNQMFRQQDVGKLKVEALKDILTDINPDIVDELELNGRVSLVGFDSNVRTVDLMQTGAVSALVVQNPYAMGYLGVETALISARCWNLHSTTLRIGKTTK